MFMLAVALFLAQASTAQPAPAPASPPRPPCAEPEFRAFDFWVGDWDVYPNGKETLVAHSKIERLYAGCAIRENWMPLKGTGGGSLSEFEPATGRWHQTWVGSVPGRVEFDGGMVGDRMVLTGFWTKSGPKGEDGLTRMIYSKEANGAVRQLGEFSGDNGLTWATSFDFIYRPHKAD